jgi:hypothetical protein
MWSVRRPISRWSSRVGRNGASFTFAPRLGLVLQGEDHLAGIAALMVLELIDNDRDCGQPGVRDRVDAVIGER